MPFRQTTERLRRRAALFDELRGVLRLAAIPQKDETAQDLDRMQERLDELVASFKKRRPERGPAQDIREAIDIILKHIDVPWCQPLGPRNPFARECGRWCQAGG